MEAAPDLYPGSGSCLESVSPACRRFRVTRTGRPAAWLMAPGRNVRRGHPGLAALCHGHASTLDSAPGPWAWPMPSAHTAPAGPTETGSERALPSPGGGGKPGPERQPALQATQQNRQEWGLCPSVSAKQTPPQECWAETTQPEKSMKNVTYFFFSLSF